MQTRQTPPVRYADVFRDHTAWRLWAASTISYIGDFVGLGALLLIAYHRSGGHPLGPGAVFGVQVIPVLVIALVSGPWLDRIPRATGMVWLCLIGAAVLALPVVFGGMWPVLVTAAVLGTIRTLYVGIRSGMMADAIPRGLRSRLIALSSVSYSSSEMLGYFTGSSVTSAIGATPALTADAATLLAAAVLNAGLRVPRMRTGRERASMLTGIRTIFADQTLSALVPVVFVGLTIGALPQTLASAELTGGRRGWVPTAMAVSAIGLAVAGAVVGRSQLPEKVGLQFGYIALCGAAFVVTALGTGFQPLLIIPGNLVVGIGLAWAIAAQTTCILVIPPDRMAHVTSTMNAAVITMEGVGAIAFGAVAGALGVPAAYLLAGVILIVAGLTGLAYTRAHPAVADLSRRHGQAPGG